MFEKLYIAPKEYVFGFFIEVFAFLAFMLTISNLTGILNRFSFYNNFYLALLFWGAYILALSKLGFWIFKNRFKNPEKTQSAVLLTYTSLFLAWSYFARDIQSEFLTVLSFIYFTSFLLSVAYALLKFAAKKLI